MLEQEPQVRETTYREFAYALAVLARLSDHVWGKMIDRNRLRPLFCSPSNYGISLPFPGCAPVFCGHARGTPKGTAQTNLARTDQKTVGAEKENPAKAAVLFSFCTRERAIREPFSPRAKPQATHFVRKRTDRLPRVA